MIVTYSRQLIEMKVSSLLSSRCSSVLWVTSSGNAICHQNSSVIEYPPHAVRELSSMISAVGILGIRCAIGVSKLIPES